MIKVQNSIFISPEEIQFRYSRSSGPGGQKVNKTNSRVELVWSYNLNTTFSAQELFIETNRTPNIASLFLQNTNITKHKTGIICNKKMQTDELNIYACLISAC